MNRLIAIFIVLIGLVNVNDVQAYPNFISYQYNACINCHYNPFGNGPLTDYGRAVGASSISDRKFREKKTSEEIIGKESGFIYQKPINEWLRPSLDYRGMLLKKNYDEKNEETEFIHMQFDANLVLRLGPKEDKDKFFISFSTGYAPTPRAAKTNSTIKKEPNIRSREHYIGWRINPNFGLYAGLMDKVYGLRVPDHISFSRWATGLSMNDQSHGVVLHYNNPKLDIGINPFVGNLSQQSNIRQTGFSATSEYSISKQSRLGFSILNSKSKFIEYFNYSVHLRTAFSKGSSIMVELGKIEKNIVIRNQKRESLYFFSQGHIKLSRGLYVLSTLEVFNADTTKKDDKVIRLGPGLQYFVNQGFEFRTDIYNTKVYSGSTVSNDSWDLTGQIHLWL
jgi:hypothetical protein